MPIIYTPGLEPDFPEGSFDSEQEHVKLIYGLLLTDIAYVNPLADDVDAIVARIDAVQALLATEMSASLSDYNAFSGFVSNLPQGWIDATNNGVSGYTSGDMSAVANTVNIYYQACLVTTNNLTDLKLYVTEIDVDNFKLHMELLSGIDDAPPQDILKPNNPSIFGLGQAIIEVEHRFGVPFTNYLLGLFGTLFTGDVTLLDLQTHLDTDPLSAGTYGPLGISAGVTKPYVSGATGEDVIWNNSIVSPKVAPLAVPVLLYNAPLIGTHKAALTTHITDDMAYYDMVTHRLNSIMKAYGISGHITDPFYAFMYTDVFGTAELNDIIVQLHNGEIE